MDGKRERDCQKGNGRMEINSVTKMTEQRSTSKRERGFMCVCKTHRSRTSIYCNAAGDGEISDTTEHLLLGFMFSEEMLEKIRQQEEDEEERKSPDRHRMDSTAAV